MSHLTKLGRTNQQTMKQTPQQKTRAKMDRASGDSNRGRKPARRSKEGCAPCAGSTLWAMMKAHAWGAVEVSGFQLHAPPEGPHSYLSRVTRSATEGIDFRHDGYAASGSVQNHSGTGSLPAAIGYVRGNAKVTARGEVKTLLPDHFQVRED